MNEARSGERGGACGVMNNTTAIATAASTATNMNMPLMPMAAYSSGAITSDAA